MALCPGQGCPTHLVLWAGSCPWTPPPLQCWIQCTQCPLRPVQDTNYTWHLLWPAWDVCHMRCLLHPVWGRPCAVWVPEKVLDPRPFPPPVLLPPACMLDPAPAVVTLGPMLHTTCVLDWLEWVLHVVCILGPVLGMAFRLLALLRFS